jgi:thymidine kinase
MRRRTGLTVIAGPMFAGKTTRLISEMQMVAARGASQILFRSSIDSRYSTTDVVSHDGLRMRAATLPEGPDGLRALAFAAKNYNMIGIDEGQFWESTDGFSEAVIGISARARVYVATLDIDSIGKPFRVFSELLPRADSIILLKSKCAKCGKDAAFSQRLVNGTEDFSNGFMVGAAGLYEPRCGMHFIAP